MVKSWFIGGLTALVLAPFAALLYEAEIRRGEEPGGAVDEASPPPAGTVAGATAAATESFDAPVRIAPRERSTVLDRIATMYDYRLGGLSLPGAIDYRDPAGGGAVPLTLVAGREDIALSEHFRLGDFAANDGAPFARIAPALVDLLERLQDRLGRRVHVTSAYRHPALNFREGIDGAVESRHMAGLAADIWADETTPIELAEAVLDIQGCRAGLGLGAGFVHVDVRDRPASWARPDAAMHEADFDLWMLERCGDSFGAEARAAIEAAACGKSSEPPTGLDAAEAYRAEMTEMASVHRRHEAAAGAVLLDVRRHVPGDDSTGRPRIAYLPSDSPLLRAMRMERLVRRADQNLNFVFILIEPDGSHRAGLMRYDGESAASLYSTSADTAGTAATHSADSTATPAVPCD